MNIYDFDNDTSKYIMYVIILIPIFLKLIIEIAIYHNICRSLSKFILFILIIYIQNILFN